MKYTIEGFSIPVAMELTRVEKDDTGAEYTIQIDCIDFVILRWFVDFYPNMTKIEIEGKQYAWVNYKNLCEDIPILRLKKQAIAQRLKKLVELGVLTHETIKQGGTYSYYGFGENYIKLAGTSTIPSISNSEGVYQNIEGCISGYRGGAYPDIEQNNKYTINNKNTKDKENVKQNSNIPYSDIISYLNTKAETSYRDTSKESTKLIKDRWKEGYRLEDFKKVIDIKVSEWKGNTKMAPYLRPSTLFGTKFESYLQQASNSQKQLNTSGAVSIPAKEEDKLRNADGSYVVF